ncbi:MAG: NifU family protein [Acidimicrobiia bacterium]
MTNIEGSIIEIAMPSDRPKNGETEIDRDLLNDTLDYIRPALLADGGDMVLTGVNEGTVHLELVGACGGCPISESTVTAGIERILRDRVPGVAEVIATGN